MLSSKYPPLPAKNQQEKGEFVWKKEWKIKELGSFSMGARNISNLNLGILDMRKTIHLATRKVKPEMGISDQDTWEEDLGKKTMFRAAGEAENL